MRKLHHSLLAILLIASFFGKYPNSEAQAELPPLAVTTTTGMIADLVQQVGGDAVTVQALMGPGVDPHLYKATPGALKLLRNADIVFYNGLHLEGKIAEALEGLGREKPVIAITATIDPNHFRIVDPAAEVYDPHIWFDLSLWSQSIPGVVDALSKLRPGLKADFQGRGDRYRAALLTAHEQAQQEIAKIPQGQRVLITAHDAFGYFASAYGLEVHALQGISTAAEFGLRDVTALTELIVRRRIPAIFVESSVSPRFIEAVQQGVIQKGFHVRIGGTLYSDALGPEGSGATTLESMFRENVRTIVTALGGSPK